MDQRQPSDQELLLEYLRQQDAQKRYNSMSGKERRQADKEQRASSRRSRDAKRASDQQKADAETYGKDSLTYDMKYGEEGKVQDVSTTETSQYTDNKTDYESDSNQRGFDRFHPEYEIPDLLSEGGGLPDYPSDPEPEAASVEALLVWEAGDVDAAKWFESSVNVFQVVKSDNTVGDFAFFAAPSE